jgi:hypothetical protein
MRGRRSRATDAKADLVGEWERRRVLARQGKPAGLAKAVRSYRSEEVKCRARGAGKRPRVRNEFRFSYPRSVWAGHEPRRSRRRAARRRRRCETAVVVAAVPAAAAPRQRQQKGERKQGEEESLGHDGRSVSSRAFRGQRNLEAGRLFPRAATRATGALPAACGLYTRYSNVRPACAGLAKDLSETGWFSTSGRRLCGSRREHRFAKRGEDSRL